MNATIRLLTQATTFRQMRLALYKFGESGLLLLLIWPWVLLAVNRSWVFLNGGSVDAWIYFGFFQNLREYQSIYASANSGNYGFYYDDRLSWILPGYLVYQLFPPLLANYILHLGLYYVVVLALYATLALVIHRRAAVLAALLMGSYSYFLNAVGWDYIDGAGLAYCSLTLLLLTFAARRLRWPLWMTAAGVTAAALVFSNLFWAALAPCIGLYYLIIHRHHSVKRIVLGIVLMVVGALSLTIALGLINLTFGGSPFFFASSLEFASQSANLAASPWIASYNDWPIVHPYLVWPLIITLASALWLAIPSLRQRLRAYPQSPALLIFFLSVALTMIALNMRGASPILQAFYYSSYLIPALFLAILVISAPLLASLSRARFAGLLSITALAALGSFTLRACGEFPVTYPALPAIILGIIWLILLIGMPHQVWSYSVFIVAFCIATPSAFGSYAAPFATYSFCTTAPQTQPEDQYLAVLDGIETIRQIAPEKRVYFWYDEDEQPIYSALSSAYLWNWNQISREFPAMSGSGMAFRDIAPPPGTTVVIVSQAPTALADAETTLRQRYRTLHLLSQKNIHHGAIQFTLFIGEIQAVPQKVPLDETLDLTRALYTDRFLRTGWGRPEQPGIWTEGSRSEMDMIIERRFHQDIDMEVDIVHSVGIFVPDPPDIGVGVFVNGVQLDTWHFNAQQLGGRFHVIIPDAVLSISDTTRIVFEIDQPHTPRDLGFNYNDTRALGIAVHSIRFTNYNFWDAQSELLGAPPPNGLRLGHSEADGWAANTVQDDEGILQYGPYTTAVSPGNHTAIWRLMIDNNTADDLPIVRLEVVDSTTNGTVLASRIVTRREWKSPYQYEDFALPFSLAATSPPHALELRIWWYDHAYVREQYVRIQ
jgi:hypothetical protein